MIRTRTGYRHFAMDGVNCGGCSIINNLSMTLSALQCQQVDKLITTVRLTRLTLENEKIRFERSVISLRAAHHYD